MGSRRVLSFQTPKKKTQTPLRPARRPQAPSPDESLPQLENKLIEAYRAENSMLRSLRSDALLYKQLLGISIKEEGECLKFELERDSSIGRKRLAFSLQDKQESFVFTLEDSVHCNVPEYFYDVIEFEKRSFPLFFYKVMQAVYETRSN